MTTLLPCSAAWRGRAGVFNTGGDGVNFTGSGLNPLGSQDSIIVSPNDDLVFAVNAGSDTIASFAADGSDWCGATCSHPAASRRSLSPSMVACSTW